MASKRKLKKTMQQIASELITNVYYKSLISEKNIDAEADALVTEIALFSREFINRIGKNGGKDPKEIKAYYNKLYADWDKEVEKIIEKYEEL